VFFCLLLDVTNLLGYLLKAIFVVRVLELELWEESALVLAECVKF